MDIHVLLFLSNESAIVVSLGEIIIKTEPRPMDALDVKTLYSSGRTQDEILTEMMSQSYDKFSLEIKNIQVISRVTKNQSILYKS